MKAHPDLRTFTPSAHGAFAGDRRSAGTTRGNSVGEVQNPRGLVLAVSMSAACWAAVALAFLL